MKNQIINLCCFAILLSIGACKKSGNDKNSQDLTGAVSTKQGSAKISVTFSHPGVMYNRADLDRMKSKINIEPWKSSYNAFKARATASITYTMQGPFSNVGREPNVNRSQYENDMTAIHDQAIMWYMTGDATYINKARSIMNAWAITHKTYSGGTPALLSGDFGTLAAIGAEIIRHVNRNWAASEITTCENYFKNVVYKQSITNNAGAPQALGESNQGASRLKSMIAIAVFCNDAAKYDYTVNAFRGNVSDAACVALGRNSLSSGQEAEAGRDQPHPLGAIGNYAQTAETAWKNGTDLYADLSNRLSAMSEYWCKYNLGNTVPYSTFGPCSATWSSISSTGRSASILWAPVEMIYAHYAVRKGMSLPYTLQYRNGLPSTGWEKRTFFFRIQ